MRTFKLIGTLVAALAFSMIGVAMASAAETLWPFLPGSVGETFTGNLDEGEAVLQEEKGAEGGSKIKCKALAILLTGSELVKEGSTSEKDATLSLAVMHFTGCKAESAIGLVEVHTKGDEKEVILTHTEIHNCLIEWLGKTKQDGVLILPLEAVIENGIVGVVTTVLDKKGTGFVAPIKKIGVSQYLIDAKQTNGLQEVKKCEGGAETESLTTLLAGAKEENLAGEDVKALIKFDKTKDVEEVLN